MAAGIFEKVLQDKGLPDCILPLSAGIYALEGMPASCYAIKAASEWGVDLRGHRARRVTEELLEGSDLVVTMSVPQAHCLRSLYPATGGRVFPYSKLIRLKAEKLREIFRKEGEESLLCCDTLESEGDLSIEDPYGKDFEVYRAVARTLFDWGNCLADSLKKGLCQ